MNSYSSFSVLGHLYLSDSGIACRSIGSFVMQRVQAIQRNRIKPMLSIFYDKHKIIAIFRYYYIVNRKAKAEGFFSAIAKLMKNLVVNFS